MLAHPRRVAVGVAVLLVFFAFSLLPPAIAQTTVVVYQSQHPVALDGAVQAGEWSDTPIATEPTTTLTYAFKQNGTGLLFLMQWNEATPCPKLEACYAGIELGHLNNTADMGTPLTPTIMILSSPSLKGNVSEFISTAESTTHTSVETEGYKTQTTCALGYAGGVYTAECYRPFKLTNASPYDFNFTIGSTAEIAFAVGFFTPQSHAATDMSTYVLSITNQTYPPTTTSSSTSSSSTSTTVSTTTSNSTTSSTSTTVSTTTSNSTTSSTSTGSTSTSVSVSSASTNVSTYAEELLVMVIGFSVLVLVVLARYERS